MRRAKSGTPGDCPLADLIDMIGGRWKVLALWHLRAGRKRFTELRRLMPGVTQKMLTQQLRRLEEDGLVWREVFAQVPPRVEYGLTATGEELSGLLLTLADWAKAHMPALESGRSRVRAIGYRSPIGCTSTATNSPSRMATVWSTSSESHTSALPSNIASYTSAV